MVAAWQRNEQADRLRIIAPIPDAPKLPAKRAVAYRAVAAHVHLVPGVRPRHSETALRDWVLRQERGGAARRASAARSVKGAARVLVTRERDAGIDLPMDRRTGIAERLVRKARRLAGDVLCRLCLQAGSRLPVAALRGLGQRNTQWAGRVDLDNGPEYSALAEAMGRLSWLARGPFGLTLAKPCSPTSKGSIEGLFNVPEQVFKGLPRWIGGRRDDKKTANEGKVVAPCAKGLEPACRGHSRLLCHLQQPSAGAGKTPCGAGAQGSAGSEDRRDRPCRAGARCGGSILHMTVVALEPGSHRDCEVLSEAETRLGRWRRGAAEDRESEAEQRCGTELRTDHETPEGDSALRRVEAWAVRGRTCPW
ncbi:hypothetical protein LHP98_15695 [Rhodobacter sp. Har01]|uniref:hypothetical protein n=1 Tax=Rhodobacter sp. Har01 TaxID=2883999 RepID=UPI001D0716F8|nr:hypothetical protein [Rhodobacter sp. Har01]MCB6179565.1 hypothetical protein [Rhodobacter sp. Har01]